MKVRATIAQTRLGAKLAAVGTMTILASAAVSACTGGTPTAEPSSSSFSPGAGGTPTPKTTPSGTPSPTRHHAASPSPSPEHSRTGSPSPSPSPSPEHHHTASPSPSPAHHHSPSPVPAAAPATGGGGTAGFQDTLVVVLGGVAVAAGAGSLAYRRRVLKNR
jgi:peptidoglycan DL-endopeptidase CwlO